MDKLPSGGPTREQYKLMRACDGCRRRKIKCTSAVANGPWPCAACRRLRVQCHPPASSQDACDPEDPSIGFPGDHVTTEKGTGDLTAHYVSCPSSLPQTAPPAMYGIYPQTYPTDHIFKAEDSSISHDYGHCQQTSQSCLPTSSGLTASAAPAAAPALPWKPPLLLGTPESTSNSSSDTEDVRLAETFRDLKIDYLAVAPYMTSQNRLSTDTPTFEEEQTRLPDHLSQDTAVRIPEEMMPSDECASKYFDFFFEHVYPYAPVLDRAEFFRRWYTDRAKISPLLLEAVFACASRHLDAPAQAAQWLALATSSSALSFRADGILTCALEHEESFKDVPRISTLQATLLLLKAREAVPKRGYYYRSWMTVVSMVAMAKDLGLHEHLELHTGGRSCDSDPGLCAVKTRIWQTLFTVEIMIGGAQGRTEFQVCPETVDHQFLRETARRDDFAYRTAYRYAYLTRIACNVRQTNTLYRQLKSTKEGWALDDDFVQHNEDLRRWLRELPSDLQITYPDDGSPPWIYDHFLANLHCYHHLTVLMHHRPQFQFALKGSPKLAKLHLQLLYNSARKLCTLQEALLQQYGLPGLLYMQRGVNFSIYCVLTCAMIQLVALTSPDPCMSHGARDYFARGMRILEQCISAWPMPEMQAQVEALREAFSEDTNRPFELKHSLARKKPGYSRPETVPSQFDVSAQHVHVSVPYDNAHKRSFGHYSDYSTNQESQEPSFLHIDCNASQAYNLSNGSPTEPQGYPETPLHQTQAAPWNPTKIFE
ncbi:hypothetical protein LTR66_012761 [Elasticomyces elasticus]|nr:hypothetical protein LTR66_012761 [Elasticomyces elasticus]